MKKKEFSHQGDVQLMSLAAIPKDAKKIEKRPVALGEKSGHQHVITGDYELFEDSKGNVYAAIGSDGASLQHIHKSNFVGFGTKKTMPVADHKPTVLTPNTNYIFGIHKKYNPFAKIWEKVID